MPKKRPYGQYCPIAQTLDVVGDRWTMLIVRELFLGPTRYGELAEALTPISTDVLAKRLRELESSGVIERRDDGSYVLTAAGTDLAPVLQALGRWGLPLLSSSTAPEKRSAARALQMLVIASIGTDLGPERTTQIQADDLTCRVSSGAHGLTAQRGTALQPDAVITTDGPTLWALALGRVTWAEAITSGAIRVDGDSTAAERMVTAGHGSC